MPDEPVAAGEEALGEAAEEEVEGLVEERAALEEAAGAFLERLLEEKRVSMLA